MERFDVNFKLVVASQAISQFGGNIFRFALILFLMDFTGSPELLGIATAVSQLPVIFFGPLGGVMADRFDKKALIIILDLAKAANAFLLFGILILGWASVWNVAAVMTVAVSIMTLFAPVLTSAVPRIVDRERLVEANGMMQTINGFSFLLGSALGGILTAALGFQNLMLLCASAFLLSVFIDFFIKVPPLDKRVQAGFLRSMARDLKESWQFIRYENTIILKMSLLFSVVTLLLQPVVAIGVPFVVQVLMGAGEDLAGISKAMAVTGLILGSIVAGKSKQWLKSTVFWKMMLAFGGSALIVAAAVHPLVLDSGLWLPFLTFSGGLFIVFFTVSFVHILVNVIMQKETPPHLLGKVSSLFSMIANVTTPVGQLLFGAVIGATIGYTHLVFIGMSVIMIFFALLARVIFSKKFTS